RDLGRIVFTGTTPDSADLAAARTAWNALDFGAPSQALVVSVAGDPNSATYPPQTRALLDGLNGPGQAAAATAPANPALGECPAVSLAPGRARRSRWLRRIFRRSDTGGAPSPKSAPPPDTYADGLVDEVDDGEGLPAGAKGQPLDLLPPPQVTASSLSVVIPTAGEAVRYQHLLLAADVPYTVEIKAREPLRQKRKRR
ncbi:MAG TPA: hypothetical protein PKW35_23735, partial [Nannocystaceae bacterium]|nr:hypothetical protein [Nannocystaceae bacterium]